MTAPTQGEAVVIAAGFLGVDPADAVGAVFIVTMADGSIGITGTGQCECGVLQIVGRAIERIASGMHAGETP